MKILITGSAGFIGFHLARNLLKNMDFEIIGLDSMNDYYDPSLKLARLGQLGIPIELFENGLVQSSTYRNYKFLRVDLAEEKSLIQLFKQENFDVVINLAAQAGVRYALENPRAYINSNIIGFFNLLEACKDNNVKHLISASSSSVYGLNEETPFSEHHNTDHPTSLYAATKKSNEVLAHSYSHIHKLPVTVLRFFTVYGPWGRPDMALFKFTKNILEDKEIEIYGHGEMYRDFTYIDDIVDSVARLMALPPMINSDWDAKISDPATSSAPFRILNIGRGKPVKISDFVKILENKLDKKAKYKYVDMQPGEVKTTFADTSELINLINYSPKVDIEKGIGEFVDWYLSYYK